MNNTDIQNSSTKDKEKISSLSLAHNQKYKSQVGKILPHPSKQSTSFFHPSGNYSHVKKLELKNPAVLAQTEKNLIVSTYQNSSRNLSQINSNIHSSTAKPTTFTFAPAPPNQSQHSRLSSLSLRGNTDFERALKAIRDGHVFEIRGWSNSAVRPYFLRRGWLEKKPKDPSTSTKVPTSISTVSQFSNASASGNPNSSGWLLDSSAQKMLDDHPANFIWACYTNQVDWPNKLDYQYINRHPQGGFAAKRFLVDTFQNLQWFENGSEKLKAEPSIGFPRSYRLYLDDEKHVFEQDFKFTACLALLKFFVSVFPSLILNSNSVSNRESRKPIDTLNSDTDLDLDLKSNLNLDRILPLVNFALLQVKFYISKRKHEDIDDKNDHSLMTQTSISMSTGLDWNSFLQQSFQVTHGQINIKNVESEAQNVCRSVDNNFDLNFDLKAFEDGLAETEEILKQVESFWPQFYIDGHRNVWIFKPANGTRGVGIILMDNYTEISQKFLTSDTKIPPWWIVQKYIERPLTIFDTKFDLRQWFLVSSWNPLIAWIYKKSYLRFSGKSFNLDDLCEKIHLTNHSVQQKYQVDDSRNSNLPPDNMWSSDQFQEYLVKIGKPNVWKEIIYKGMKQILLSVLLSFRDSITQWPRTFQMQGADFLVTDNFRPYLIEINGTPVLSNSTKVTARLCPQACIDSIRVALDWNAESSKNTTVGDFELFYREPSKLKPPLKTPQDFVLQGKPL